jgi:hypothetical protein
MALFSLNLVQYSTVFISLVATYIVFAISIWQLQYVLQYVVINTYIAHFSVALAT